MAENLKVTHYRNGEAIHNVTDSTKWHGLITGAYCEYENRVDSAAIYGRLYNWFSVNDRRSIAPLGWHVASDSDWKILADYLGGDSVAGGKMKETASSHWKGLSVNTGATNKSGFTGLPGGYRDHKGHYGAIGLCTYFWSTTERTSSTVWDRSLGHNYSDLDRSYGYKQHGFSVRCVKD